jgi:ATP-dependent Lon protease
MAALRAGIHRVIVPAENESDLKELDEAVRGAINFITADHLDKILDVALRPGQRDSSSPCVQAHVLPPEAEHGSVGIAQ